MRGFNHPWRWRALPIVAAIAVTPALALAQSTVEIIAPSAPPPVRTEVVPPPPSAGIAVTWESGRWNWRDNQWVWMPGHYVNTPHVAWEPGHWAQEPNGWLWVEGRWRVAER